MRKTPASPHSSSRAVVSVGQQARTFSKIIWLKKSNFFFLIYVYEKSQTGSYSWVEKNPHIYVYVYMCRCVYLCWCARSCLCMSVTNDAKVLKQMRVRVNNFCT